MTPFMHLCNMDQMVLCCASGATCAPTLGDDLHGGKKMWLEPLAACALADEGAHRTSSHRCTTTRRGCCRQRLVQGSS
jgi:hypothetical protein